MTQQHEFVVRVTLPNGLRLTHCGRYASGCDAIVRALEAFEPTRVSAMRVKPEAAPALGGVPGICPAKPVHRVHPVTSTGHFLTQEAAA